MVCKECGAYNAENLTHCRICAAKLRDTEAPVTDENTKEETDETIMAEDRPKRSFVKAPTWPTRAYEGAEENRPITRPQRDEAVTRTVLPTAQTVPVASKPEPAPVSEPASAAAFCPSCGKPAIEGAAFCPFCGAAVSAAPAAAIPVVTRPEPPAPKKEFTYDDYEDDEFGDEDFEDEPVPKKAAKKPAKPAKKAAKRSFGKPVPVKDDEDEFSEADEFDDESEFDMDDEFDDEDEFDDDDEEFDDEDDDDMPKKRGTSILFWGLIVLLVALIAIFGIYIVKKNGGSVSSALSSLTGGKKQGDEQSGDSETADPALAETVSQINQMNTASISEYIDPSTGELSYDVNIYAPTGSTVELMTDASLKNGNTATIPSNDHVILRIAHDVFMPNKPCETESVTITPNIQVTTPQGETIQLRVDDIIVTVPRLSMTVEQPEGDTVQQTYNNDPIEIKGTVDNPELREIYVNDVAYPVYEGGVFTVNYTPTMPVARNQASAPAVSVVDTAAGNTVAAPATEGDSADEAETDEADEQAEAAEAAETNEQAEQPAVSVTEVPAATVIPGSGEVITIEARMNNYVTARKIITIEPFVMKDMALSISNSAAVTDAAATDDLYTTDGKITVTGAVTPGASLEVKLSDAAITCTQPTVDPSGNFTMDVTMTEVGAYDVTITAKQDGYNDTSATFKVENAPSVKYSSFLKECNNISKDYDKIVSGEITSGKYQGTGKVLEILSTSPYTVYRVQLSGTENEIICVHRSLKSKIDNGDIKEKKQVIGTLTGLYEDGKTPMLWTWYSLNKN